MAQAWKLVRQTRRSIYILEAGLAQTRWFAGHCRPGLSAGIRNRVVFQWRAPGQGLGPSGRNDMLRADLLKPDLLSKIVLLGSAALLFASLMLVVATSLTRG